MKIKRMLAILIITSVCTMTLTACKIPFIGGGSKGKTKVAEVQITPGYLNDKISYLAAKKVADKYGISMKFEDIKAYVDENYGSNKVNTPSDILTDINSMKKIVGEEEAYNAYAQVYVEAKANEMAQKSGENMTPEEINEYKTQYKDYLDSLGIPEGERDSYVQKLKQIFSKDDLVNNEFKRAMDEATKEVVREYAPELVSEK